MSSFKDQAGREWLLALDGPKIRDVRRELNIDLSAVDGKAYEAMIDDYILLVDTLWVLVRSQAAAKNFTDVMFGEAIVGDAIERATEALLAAITDFFPTRKKELIQTLAKKNQATRDLGMAEVLATMNDPETTTRIQTAMKAEIRAKLENLLTRFGSATNSPESSESAPTVTPSVS